MSTYATATAEFEQPGVDPVYLTRDDLARTLQPINTYECMLVTVIAQTWLQLQHARELEAEVFAQTRPFDLFSTRLGNFQAITRYIADSDRAWRQANAAFDRVKRNRPPQPILRPRTSPYYPGPGLQNEPNPTPVTPNPTTGLQNEPNPTPATPTRQDEPNPAAGLQNKANPAPVAQTAQNEPNPTSRLQNPPVASMRAAAPDHKQAACERDRGDRREAPRAFPGSLHENRRNWNRVNPPPFTEQARETRSEVPTASPPMGS